MSPVCAFKPRTEKIYPFQSSLYTLVIYTSFQLMSYLREQLFL